MMGCVTSNKGLSCGDDPDYDRIRDFWRNFMEKNREISNFIRIWKGEPAA